MVDRRLVERIQASRRILVVTGAGVSTASGIPDFRGPGGVWTRRRPVYYDEFLASDAARVEYWDFKLETWEIYQHARPNAVHHAIVALELAGKVAAVVTQNVDGLHRRAGTSPGGLIELHGTDLVVECQRCHATSDFLTARHLARVDPLDIERSQIFIHEAGKFSGHQRLFLVVFALQEVDRVWRPGLNLSANSRSREGWHRLRTLP